MLTLSFILDGDFAAFKDPSITTNQTVYHIPSKSSVIGLIGAIMGINRTHSFKQIYSEDYIQLAKKLLIGIELLSEPKKITYYTNHRSLKESKTKPFKEEILQFPKYKIYLSSNHDGTVSEIFNRIENNNFEYLPYLGHAYCPARLKNAIIHSEYSELNDEEDDGIGFQTSTVVLDESENYNNSFEMLNVDPIMEDSSILIERHLHHFFFEGEFQSRVLKFWIPVNSKYSFFVSKKPDLSKFVNIGKKGNDIIVCLY